jgi:hypothetical protein
VTSGEAWEGGPLIISWHDVQMAGDGYNVVIHEFAHKLDMLNGEADGIPALHSGHQRGRNGPRPFLPPTTISAGASTAARKRSSTLTPATIRPNFSPCCRKAFLSCPTVVDREYPPSTPASNATTVRIPWLD